MKVVSDGDDSNTHAVDAASDFAEQMTHLGLFCAQVGARSFRNARLAGNALDDMDARAFQLADFFRVVGQEPDFCCPELFQNLRGKGIVARVSCKSQGLVGFHSVHAAVLELVCAELVHQSDSPAFLRQIEENTGARLADFTEGKLKLGTAVATKRSEDVTGQALGMHTNERRRLLFERAPKIAANQRDRLFLRAPPRETVNCEPSISSREVCLRDLPHGGMLLAGRLTRL
jgi:hypothetical protein